MTNSPFKKLKTKIAIPLHPSRLEDPKVGIEEYLNNRILKYDQRFKGFLLSYSDISVGNNNGVCFFERAHILIQAKVTLLFLCLKTEDFIVGVVNEIHPDHFNALILDSFPCTIKFSEHAKTNANGDLVLHGHQVLKGAPIWINIKSVGTENKTLKIVGSVEEEGCGPIETCGPKADKSAPLAKKEMSDGADSEDEYEMVKDLLSKKRKLEDPEPPKPKKKRKYSFQEGSDEPVSVLSDIPEPSKKNKKKKRKRVEVKVASTSTTSDISKPLKKNKKKKKQKQVEVKAEPVAKKRKKKKKDRPGVKESSSKKKGNVQGRKKKKKSKPA